VLARAALHHLVLGEQEVLDLAEQLGAPPSQPCSKPTFKH
jgi:hypothetical protein